MVKALSACVALLVLVACEKEAPPPPPRTPAKSGTLVVRGKVWPGAQLELGYSYRTNGDIPACRQANMPVGEWTERGAGGSTQGRADKEGNYRLEVQMLPPDDGGSCQWKLANAELRFRLGSGGSAIRLSTSTLSPGAHQSTDKTAKCWKEPRADGSMSANCIGGQTHLLDLLPFDAQGRRELTFNIEEVEPPAPVRQGIPVDQMVGSPAYNERIRREQEAAEAMMSSPE